MAEVKRQRGAYRSPLWIDSFCGGSVCLDFVNTVEWIKTPKAEERLTDYLALLTWSRARATLAGTAVDRLETLAKADPAAAEAVFQDALGFREELRALLHRLEAGEAPEITSLNQRLTSLPPLPPLSLSEGGYQHDLPGRDLAEPLWPVLWSLSALLISDDAGRLGSCGGQACGYLFIDLSRNHSRRWCTSEGCGNRERVRRAYKAQKA
jgi:predicted RNA-binding Zn ribbon-like protein